MSAYQPLNKKGKTGILFTEDDRLKLIRKKNLTFDNVSGAFQVGPIMIYDNKAEIYETEVKKHLKR